MPEPALELRGVRHRFGRRETLSGLDLDVADGSVHGFLGRNGAGKTTTIRLIFGLLRLRHGEIRLGGRTVRGHPPSLYRETAVLFEDFTAPPYLSAERFLRMRAAELGIGRAEAVRRAGAWLERVGLAADGRRRTRAFSLGMRRRLGLAAALLGEPRLIVLDEPTNGLDPQGIVLVRSILSEEHRARGATFLLSSHVLGEIEKLCDAVSILEGGRVARSGAVSALTAPEAPRFRLRLSPRERALSILSQSALVRSVEEIEPSDDEQTAASFELTLERDTAPDVVRALVDGEVDVFEMTPLTRTLEDVFNEEVSAVVADGDGSR